MSTTASQSYDELPYTCHPLQYTLPDNLACKAVWCGLTPPNVENSRVLELGCGTGGNLLPMADLMPKAKFVGVDYSPRQIELARAATTQLALSNVEFLPLALADVTDELGKFDYIICHGVFSWVSRENQEHIFRVIQKLLNPQGVAYVSYNIYPGWHLREVVRDIFNYLPRSGSPAEQVKRARAYCDFITNHLPDQEDVYAQLLKHETKVLKPMPDAYIFHEQLEEENLPIYFRDFMARASNHQLQFLYEARFLSQEASFPAEVRTKLQTISRSRIDYEQHVDFLCGGTFRRSLLCHAGHVVMPQKVEAVLPKFRISGVAVPVNAEVNIHSDTVEEFQSQKDVKLSTGSALMKAILVVLHELRPRALSFEELFQLTLEKFNAHPTAKQSITHDRLCGNLLRLHQNQCLEVHLHESPLATRLGSHPRVAATTRWQAATGEPVNNRRYRLPEISPFERLLFSLLDGSRDHATLKQVLVDKITQGALVMETNGKPIREPRQIEQVVTQILPLALKRCVDHAFLVE